MADVSLLVLNDVLCFLVNKFGKLAVKSLKGALTDFYSVDALAEAKIQLINDVDSMKLPSKRLYIPLRCDSEVDNITDIISLFTFVDENKAMDLLPKYVSSSPDNMPSLRLYDGDST